MAHEINSHPGLSPRDFLIKRDTRLAILAFIDAIAAQGGLVNDDEAHMLQEPELDVGGGGSVEDDQSEYRVIE